MKTVYRYEINNNTGVNKIQMPSTAKVLSVGFSGENSIGQSVVSIWALVETTDITTERTFIVAGTGADLDEVMTYDTTYIGTVCKSNRYAFHVFEVRDKNNIF